MFIVELYIVTFENELSPPVIDAERLHHLYTYTPRVKNIILSVAVRCKGVWDKDLAFIAQYIYNNMSRILAAILVSSCYIELRGFCMVAMGSVQLSQLSRSAWSQRKETMFGP